MINFNKSQKKLRIRNYFSLLVILILCFSSQIPLHAETLKVPRADGSIMQFYLETPNKDKFPIIVVIHGSNCESSWPLFQSMKSNIIANGIGIASIEKYGLNETTSECPQLYLQNNTVQQRIKDHTYLVKFFRRKLSGWNNKIAWVGGSEGGQIASLVAPLTPETSALVMLASGGGMTMAEELPLVFTKLLTRNGASKKQITMQLNELQSYYREIKYNPTWKREWLSDRRKARNTYKYWNSILWIKALPQLEHLQVPIYIAHGTEDTSSSYESSKLIANRFSNLGKLNLLFKSYQGLEHNFSNLQGTSYKQEVLSDATNWVIKILKYN